MDKETAKTRFQEATYLYQKGDYGNALTILKELDKFFPDNNRILFALAEVYAKQGNMNMALRIAHLLNEQFGDERSESLLSRLEGTVKSSFEQEKAAERAAEVERDLPDCIFCGTWKPGKFYVYYKCMEFKNPDANPSIGEGIKYYHRKDYKGSRAYVCGECARKASGFRMKLLLPVVFSLLVAFQLISGATNEIALLIIGLADSLLLLITYLQYRSVLYQDSRHHSKKIEDKVVQTLMAGREEHGFCYWYPTLITDYQYRRDNSLLGLSVLAPPWQEKRK